MNFTSELIILLALGIAGGLLFKYFKMPTIVGYIFGGMVFSLLLGIKNDSSIIDLAQIGITLLLFSMGIDFSLDKLTRVKKYVFIGGIAQILFTIVFGFLFFQVFRFDKYQSLFLGAIFSLSSTVIVVKIIEERGELETIEGQITLGWLILQDIAVVVIVLMLSIVGEKDLSTANIFQSLLKCITLILLSLIIGRKVIPRILSSVSRVGGKDILIILSFGFAIFFAFLSEQLGIPSTLGAFLAGLMISESVYTHEIITEIKPFQIIFSMLFFVTIGTLFSVSYFIQNFFLIILILISGLLIKAVSVLFLNYILKLNIKTNVYITLALLQIGEFAFLISQIALKSKWISQDFTNLIIAVTILSMLTSPLLLTNFDKVYAIIDRFMKKRAPLFYRRLSKRGVVEAINPSELSNHVIICGYGKVGKYVANGLKIIGEDFVVIDVADEEINKALPSNFIVGDATNKDILLAAKLEKARICVITTPKDTDVNVIIRLCEEINPDIKIITRIHNSISEDNMKFIHSLVEPEFETANRMLEKILIIFNKHNKKGLLR